MIALEQVSLALGEFHLHEVDLRISAGEYLVIIGPSGAGKTVLLETIAGLRSPDRGRILIGGADAGSMLPENRQTALVYQDYSLFPHMTASENIAFGLKLRHIPVKEIDRRVRSLLTQFSTLHCSDHYPSSMSGGEQQRVALARALATEPAVLLLDEPFASLDPQARDECVEILQVLRDTRTVSIIQVSHSCEDAYALADRTAVLIGGRIIQSGKTDEIFRHPVSGTVARFVGMENLFTGLVLDGGSGYSRVSIAGEAVRIPGVYTMGTEVRFGIAGESVMLISPDVASSTVGMNRIDVQIQQISIGRDTVTFKLGGPLPLISVARRSDGIAERVKKGDRMYAFFNPDDVVVFPEAE